MSIKFGILVAAFAVIIAPGSPAEARGCLKGAAVGAVGGHFAHHHALAGAAAGCAVGHVYARHHMARAHRR